MSVKKNWQIISQTLTHLINQDGFQIKAYETWFKVTVDLRISKCAVNMV